MSLFLKSGLYIGCIVFLVNLKYNLLYLTGYVFVFNIHIITMFIS